MKKFALFALLLSPLLLGAASPEDVRYSYGTVRSVSGHEIVVTEYDYDKDADTDVAYDVSGAKFENVSSPSEIKPDDTIDFMFREENGRRVVINASVERPAKLGIEELGDL